MQHTQYLYGVLQNPVDDHVVRPHHQLVRALDLELEVDRRGEGGRGGPAAGRQDRGRRRLPRWRAQRRQVRPGLRERGDLRGRPGGALVGQPYGAGRCLPRDRPLARANDADAADEVSRWAWFLRNFGRIEAQFGCDHFEGVIHRREGITAVSARRVVAWRKQGFGEVRTVAGQGDGATAVSSSAMNAAYSSSGPGTRAAAAA